MILEEKKDIDLKYEKSDNLEMLILEKKFSFLYNKSKKSLKKEMIKKILSDNDECMLQMCYLLPINSIFMLLSLLSVEAGYNGNISRTLFVIGVFFSFSYFIPIVRQCMLKFSRNKTKERIKHKIFMESIAENDVLKLFIKKYGKVVLAEMMVGKDNITYNDLYNYHCNHYQKQKEYKKINEVLDCL